VSPVRQATYNPLIRKLEHYVPLSADDRRVLDELGETEEHYRANQDIVVEGQVPRSVFVLLSGLACRYRILRDGRRQIMTFLLPGDLCDLHMFLLRVMDHSIGTITDVTLAAIPTVSVLEMAVRHPRVSVALWWSSMQQEAILRERIVALGRRDAVGRVAYILCELVWRQQAIGLSNGSSVTLPLTQNELADTLGLTAVHINRVLQILRRDRLLTLEHRRLELLDIDKLADIAGFNKDYLHLGPAPPEIIRHLDRR